MRTGIQVPGWLTMRSARRTGGRHLSLPRQAGQQGGRGDPQPQPGRPGQVSLVPPARQRARAITETTSGRQAGIAIRIFAWVGHRQQELSDRVHAAGDAAARQYGWAITKNTGRLGFGARSYRDPRFNNRRQQLSLREQDAAMPTVRQRQQRPARPTPASSPDGTARAHGLEQADGTSGETHD